MKSRLAIALLLLMAMAARDGRAASAPTFVYFGTYTGPKTGSEGIYVSTFDPATGRLGEPKLAAPSENPSFLALHPTRPLLYAVNEVSTFEGEPAGSVSAFEIDAATGLLRALNRVSSKGGGPCHLAVDHAGRRVLVANYGGGSVASLPIGKDGRLEPASGFVQHTGAGADPKRQKGPHAHMITSDPAGRLVLAADLGLDKVLLYRLDAKTGQLVPADPPHLSTAPGAGPRHFAFSTDGKDLYVFNEIRMTITQFRTQGERFVEGETVSSLPPGVSPGEADSGAEILAHPSGRFVYASNRGVDQLAVFARDTATGRLTLVEHVPSGGKGPRSFGIDPRGGWLVAVHQRSESGQVAVFRIDPSSGRLSPTGQTLQLGAPVSVVFFKPRQ
jgi:6-phosphogluconolactonase